MNIKKIKEILMSKKGMAITGAVVGGMLIVVAGVAALGSKGNIKEDNKVVAISKAEENNKDKVEKERVDKVTDKDTIKVSEDSKKENNDTTTDKEIVDATKDKKDENKEVVSNTSSNSTSSNITSNNSNSSNSGNTSQVEKPNKPTNTNTHSHSWEEIYNNVNHDEVGHWEDILISGAWDEEVPVYEDVYKSICNGCGSDITGFHNEHMEEQMLAGNYSCGSWTGKRVEVQVGTNTINHPAKYDKKWVVDKAAWTEKVLSGHKCSCGVTK